MSARIPDPDAWTPRAAGLGTCFHRVLSRWSLFQQEDSAHGWRVAVGVVVTPSSGKIYEQMLAMGAMISPRHVHAWLERDGDVISAVNGELYQRDFYYLIVGVEERSVRLVNPRKLLRSVRRIDRDAVTLLLAAWGGRYHVEPNGGVVAD